MTNLLLGVAVVVASLGSQPAMAAPAAPTGVDSFETPAGVGSDGAQVFNRSHSSADSSSVGAISQPKSVTNSSPGLVSGFDGLNHFAQRFGSGTGDQFSLEPPDQGLCVGSDGSNTRVVEVVNDVMRVYDTNGTALTVPTALNGFFGYPVAVERDFAADQSDPNPPTQIFGPFVTDPSCLYDAGTGRWFVDVLTLDTFPFPDSQGQQDFTGANHLDIAVSPGSDPTAPAQSWQVFRIPVQDDGTNGTPNHHCSTGPTRVTPTNAHACIGDYPHLGSDANGIYLTTNEYSLFGNEFHGAQIYAISKSDLVGGSLVFQQYDTSGNATTDPGGQGDPFGFALNGFTLWPSVTPTSTNTGYGAGDSSNGGTEHFLSSNSAAEAHDTGNGQSSAIPSTQLLSWSLSNTSSLHSGGRPTLSVSKFDVGRYMPPPLSEQKSGNQPLRDCLNSNPCVQVLEGVAKDPFAEKSNGIDSNDSRMQQVTWVNGSLWGALDTALSTSNSKQAGIEWFDVSAAGAQSGYVGLGNDNLTYPAIAITAGGTGVMAFTVVGSDFYPSAGYATIGSNGVSDVHIAAAGVGPDDGFTDYRLFANPPTFIARPRWGDYGAAVAFGNGVWIASEYIGQSCDFSTYKATNFRCFNTRTALANWDTRISLVSAP